MYFRGVILTGAPTKPKLVPLTNAHSLAIERSFLWLYAGLPRGTFMVLVIALMW